MVRRDNPCFGCEERELLCSVDCTAWATYVKKRDADYNDVRRRAESDYVGHVIDRIERCRKRIQRKNRRMQ